MLRKSLLLTLGGLVFVIGMILFPLPVPFGLPIMLIGLAIMFNASYKVRRTVIVLASKHPQTHKLWKKVKTHRKKNRTQ